jgi:phosphate/sulfate permease
MKTVKLDLIKKIMVNWVLAPSLAFLISFFIMKTVS